MRVMASLMLLLVFAPLARAADPDQTPVEGPSSAADRKSGTVGFSGTGATASPQGRKFGLGLQLGYPTALTAKIMTRPDQGVVLGLGGGTGFSYLDAALSLHADYLWHPSTIARTDVFNLTWYVGAGGMLNMFSVPRKSPPFGVPRYYPYSTNLWVGGRVPIGVNMAFVPQPFELYLEAVPSIMVFPTVAFGVGAALGGRFYF